MAATAFLAALKSRRSRIVFLWVIVEHALRIPCILSHVEGALLSLAPVLMADVDKTPAGSQPWKALAVLGLKRVYSSTSGGKGHRCITVSHMSRA